MHSQTFGGPGLMIFLPRNTEAGLTNSVLEKFGFAEPERLDILVTFYQLACQMLKEQDFGQANQPTLSLVLSITSNILRTIYSLSISADLAIQAKQLGPYAQLK